MLVEAGEGEEWEEEIKEAAQARHQKTEWLKNNPRPVPQPAMMQRRAIPPITQNRVLSTTPTTPIDTSVRT